MLEVFVDLLKSYAGLLKDASSSSNDQAKESQELVPNLGETVMCAIAETLSGSNPNCAVFRELGGAGTVINLVKLEESRPSALVLLQQLILSSGGEDDMTSLLELLHTSSQVNVSMKAEILRALILCLRESHRSRAVFR